MNMYLHELKAYRKSTIIWSCSLALLMVFFLSIYPSVAKEGEEFNKLIMSYPEAVRKAFGIIMDLTSFLGYYSYVFQYVILFGAIQAMNLGTSIISKEVRQKTADFLLTKPVKRSEIITSKLLAVLTSLVLTNIACTVFGAAIGNMVKVQDFSMKIFLLISLTLFFVQIIFMALGAVISVASAKIKSVIAVSVGTVFGFFILNMFSLIIGDDALRYITPFRYFDTAYIIKNSGYEIQFLVIGLIFAVLATAACYVIYTKKDIHAV